MPKIASGRGWVLPSFSAFCLHPGILRALCVCGKRAFLTSGLVLIANHQFSRPKFWSYCGSEIVLSSHNLAIPSAMNFKQNSFKKSSSLSGLQCHGKWVPSSISGIMHGNSACHHYTYFTCHGSEAVAEFGHSEKGFCSCPFLLFLRKNSWPCRQTQSECPPNSEQNWKMFDRKKLTGFDLEASTPQLAASTPP